MSSLRSLPTSPHTARAPGGKYQMMTLAFREAVVGAALYGSSSSEAQMPLLDTKRVPHFWTFHIPEAHLAPGLKYSWLQEPPFLILPANWKWVIITTFSFLEAWQALKRHPGDSPHTHPKASADLGKSTKTPFIPGIGKILAITLLPLPLPCNYLGGSQLPRRSLRTTVLNY